MRHWNAYPVTLTAPPPVTFAGAIAPTSNEFVVGLETVTFVGGRGRVGATAVEYEGVH